jgi:hypothetical protein
VFLFLPNGLVARVWHKGHEAGDFDRVGDHALVSGTEFVAAGSADLELSRDKRAQKFGVFIIDVFDIVFAKFALHVGLVNFLEW